MSLIKLAYDNSKYIDAKKLIRGDKDAIIKTQSISLKTVTKRGTT